MDWKDGDEICFRTERRHGPTAVYKAVVGDGHGHRYVFLPEERLAFKVHSVKCVQQWWVKKELLESSQRVPSAIFIPYNIAKSVNARHNGNQDCDRKGCLDRYDCIWYNAEKETEPWNKIPKTHVPGEEHCPRCILRQHLNKDGKPRMEREECASTKWVHGKQRIVESLWPSLQHILFDESVTDEEKEEFRKEIRKLLM